MSLKIWEINNLSLELDLEDVDTLERYESAFEKMAEKEKTIAKEGKQSAIIRAYCEMYRNLYDNLFGKGTAEKIFDGIKLNAEKYDEIYFSFLEFVRKQILHTQQRKSETIKKYLPQNRQHRRLKK